MPDTWSQVESPTGLKIPILPAQDQPETQTSEKPYIIYTYDISPTTDLFQYQEEIMMMRVFSQAHSTISATMKLCVRLFNQFDISARNINEWLLDTSENGIGKYATGNSEYDQWLDEAQNYRFKVVSVSGISGAQPADGEGRRVDAVITLNLEFIEIDMGDLVSDNASFAK